MPLHVNEGARELVSAVAERFGGKAFAVVPNTNDSEAEPGSVVLVFVHPTRREHRLQVRQRGNTFEVAYSDGAPPGPAEQLFVQDAPGQLREVIQAVVIFLARVFSGQVVVLRERLGPLARLLRGDNCDSLLCFSTFQGITPRKRRRLVALYEWRER